MRHSEDITFLGVKMTAHGIWLKGYAGTWHKPPEGNDFIVESVTIFDEDIDGLLEHVDDAYDRIREIVLNQIED